MLRMGMYQKLDIAGGVFNLRSGYFASIQFSPTPTSTFKGTLNG